MSDINGAFFVMFRLFPVIFGLFSLQLPSGLTRQSRDPRNALRLSEDDRRKNNTVIPVLDTGI